VGQALSSPQHAILIVEDEPFIRDDLVDFFEDAGFEVFDAESADHAIGIMEANPSIGIVLTDVDMPGSMNGVKLAHLIYERYPPTLLIIGSGAVKAKPSEVPIGTMFFSKPFDQRSVLNSIQKATLPF
jgi:DNA-binding NtrC family response regulator